MFQIKMVLRNIILWNQYHYYRNNAENGTKTSEEDKINTSEEDKTNNNYEEKN